MGFYPDEDLLLLRMNSRSSVSFVLLTLRQIEIKCAFRVAFVSTQASYPYVGR